MPADAPSPEKPELARKVVMTQGNGPRFILICLAMTSTLVGFFCLFIPGLFQTHLTPMRCAFTLIYSALSFAVAYRGSYLVLRFFCAGWAACFGALAWVGYAIGVPATRHIGPAVADSNLIVILQNQIELGRSDHRIHLVLAGLFLLAAILPKSWDQKAAGHDEV
jgi:hypothetical protein